jgi:hypothetical protein
MGIRHLIRAVPLVFAVGCASGALAGPLTGQTIGATNDNGAIQPASSAVVDAGLEFTSFRFGDLDFFSADLTEDGDITVEKILAGGLSHGASHVISFFDIFGTIPAIINVLLVDTPGVSGFDSSDISFDADSVTLQLGNGTSWSARETGVNVQIRLEFAQVPEPGTLALAVAATALLGGARVRRKA